MHSIITSKIVNSYIKKGIIDKEEQDIYLYCFNHLISQIISTIIILTIAIIFDAILESIMFFIGFVLIRKCSGGFHAKSQVRCLIISIINFLVLIGSIYLCPAPFRNFFCILIVALCIFCGFHLAPIDHANKKFSAREWNVYRKLGRIISLSLSILILVCCFVVPNNKFVFCFSIGICSANISLICAYLERRKKSD